MNCQQIDKYIYEYCDGNLSPEIGLQIEEHFGNCEACSNMVQLTRMENEALKDILAVDAIDDNFTSRVMGAVSTLQASQSQADIHRLKNSRIRKVSLFVVAAAAVVLLMTGVLPDFYNTFNIGNESAQFELANKGIADKQFESDQSLVTDPNQEQKMLETGGTGNAAAFNDGDSGNPGTTVSNNDSDNTVSDNTSIDESANNNQVLQIAMRSVTDAPVTEDISTELLQSDMTLSTRDDTSAALKTLSPNRFRSYAVSLANDADGVLVMPVNLPENYILSVSSDSGSAVNFTYTEVNTNQTVEISVEPYSAPMSYISVAADKELNDDKTPFTDTGSSTQLLEVIAEYEDITYLVKIKSSLSNEELLKLAESIKLGQL